MDRGMRWLRNREEGKLRGLRASSRVPENAYAPSSIANGSALALGSYTVSELAQDWQIVENKTSEYLRLL